MMMSQWVLVAWLSAAAASAPVVDAAAVVDAGLAFDAGFGEAVASGAEAALPKVELPSPDPELAGADLDLGWTLVRTMVVLGLVVALMYLTLNIGLRKLLGIRPTSAARIVTVLERVVLDQKRALFVVEAAGEFFLVGGADSSLTLLSKLDPAEVQKLKTDAPAGAPAVRLSPLLQKLLGRKGAPPPTT
jgi:flagellar biogenesis protein FliO